MDTRKVVRVFLEGKGDKFLFQKALTNPKKFRLPGGGIEKGETPKQTVIREMFEEFDIPKEVSSKAKFLGKKNTEYFFHLKNHGLKPGSYQDKDNLNTQNVLLYKKPSGPNYWGPDPSQYKLAEQLQKNAKFMFPSATGIKETINGLKNPNNYGNSSVNIYKRKPGIRETMRNISAKTNVAIDNHLGSIGKGMRQFGPQIIDAFT